MSKFYLHPGDKNRERILANLHSFVDRLPESKGWQIDVGPIKKEFSGKQQRALFGVAYKELGQQTGFTKNELHEYYCGEFFGWKEKWVFGKKQDVPVRTTTTDEDGNEDPIEPAEYARLYDFIQMRAAEMGLYVSDPDPLWFQQKAKK